MSAVEIIFYGMWVLFGVKSLDGQKYYIKREFYGLYSLPDTKTRKLRRMRWVGHVHEILVGKPEGK